MWAVLILSKSNWCSLSQRQRYGHVWQLRQSSSPNVSFRSGHAVLFALVVLLTLCLAPVCSGSGFANSLQVKSSPGSPVRSYSTGTVGNPFNTGGGSLSAQPTGTFGSGGG